MNTQSKLQLESPTVHSHLLLLQGVISRMAGNSASCKTWCVTLVSALVVVVAESGNARLLLIAALPIVMFGALDTYYLGLERRFRGAYEGFVRKLHAGTAALDDAFLITPRVGVPSLLWEVAKAVLSFSVWPFYAGLTAILWLLGTRLSGGAG